MGVTPSPAGMRIYYSQPCLLKTLRSFDLIPEWKRLNREARTINWSVTLSVCTRVEDTTHLVFLLRRGRWVNERQLHHRFPDVCTWAFGCQLKLNRFVQVCVLGGKNGPVRPHAEERVAAAEDHRLVPGAVLEAHCRQTDRTSEALQQLLQQPKTVNTPACTDAGKTAVCLRVVIQKGRKY